MYKGKCRKCCSKVQTKRQQASCHFVPHVVYKVSKVLNALILEPEVEAKNENCSTLKSQDCGWSRCGSSGRVTRRP
jgi:hypothetical protein